MDLDLRDEIVKWSNEWKQRITDDSHWSVVQGDSLIYKRKPSKLRSHPAHCLTYAPTMIFWPGDRSLILRDNSENPKPWSAQADSDLGEGYSGCELTRSPTGNLKEDLMQMTVLNFLFYARLCLRQG